VKVTGWPIKDGEPLDKTTAVVGTFVTFCLRIVDVLVKSFASPP
jgi:hypothetical protein